MSYQPNIESITLGSSFDTATDVGSLKALDEVWLDLTINSGNKGFFKFNNDLNFKDYDRLFATVFREDFGFRTYDSSGNLLGSFQPYIQSTNSGTTPATPTTTATTYTVNFSQNNHNETFISNTEYNLKKSIYNWSGAESILFQKPYSNNASVVEFYQIEDKPLSSLPLTFKAMIEHSKIKILGTPTGNINDLGDYDGSTTWGNGGLPFGTKIYTNETFKSMKATDGFKLTLTKDTPIIFVL